jgi:hypothetical protein
MKLESFDVRVVENDDDLATVKTLCIDSGWNGAQLQIKLF